MFGREIFDHLMFEIGRVVVIALAFGFMAGCVTTMGVVWLVG